MDKSELSFDQLIQIGWRINDYGSPELRYQDCELAILDPIIKPLELWVTRVGARTMAQYQILIHKPMTIQSYNAAIQHFGDTEKMNIEHLLFPEG